MMHTIRYFWLSNPACARDYNNAYEEFEIEALEQLTLIYHVDECNHVAPGQPELWNGGRWRLSQCVPPVG